jgi:hypothetical protein
LIRQSISGGSCATKGMTGMVGNRYVSRPIMSALIVGGSVLRRIKRASVRRGGKCNRLQGNTGNTHERAWGTDLPSGAFLGYCGLAIPLIA